MRNTLQDCTQELLGTVVWVHLCNRPPCRRLHRVGDSVFGRQAADNGVADLGDRVGRYDRLGRGAPTVLPAVLGRGAVKSWPTDARRYVPPAICWKRAAAAEAQAQASLLAVRPCSQHSSPGR